MENENTTTAVENGMTVTEPNEAAEQINLDDLAQSLTQEPPAQEVEEKQVSEEEARLNAYRDGIQSLYDDEWTPEELTAFSRDAGVHEDLKNGKTVRQAARAYLRRMAEGVKEKPAAKKSVPTVRTASGTASKQGSNFIEEMTSAQFREFSRKAQEAMMSGKNVSFD